MIVIRIKKIVDQATSKAKKKKKKRKKKKRGMGKKKKKKKKKLILNITDIKLLVLENLCTLVFFFFF